MNPRALSKFANRAAKVGEALWPATVIIGGIEYPAECPRRVREKVGLVPGYEEVQDQDVVRIRKENMPTAPAMHSLVKFDGTMWKIRAIGGETPTNPVWSLTLERKK
jgi:hypothetical protein